MGTTAVYLPSALVQMEFSFLVSVREILLRFGPQCLFIHLTCVQTRNDIPDSMLVIYSQTVNFDLLVVCKYFKPRNAVNERINRVASNERPKKTS
jgi:hypothetical protein